MKDTDIYTQILGIVPPWKVDRVAVDSDNNDVMVYLKRIEGGKLCCPECGKEFPGHDAVKRNWRQKNTCQYRTILVAEVPRVKCSEHGVVETKVPWAEQTASL